MSGQLEYLYGLERFGIQPGLERMQVMMDALGHPERNFSSIHIAGTNGKGSTAAFLESIARRSGYRVGLYTSPDLITFHERIQIDREQIRDGDLNQLISDHRRVFERAHIQPTFFEFSTALAFSYFSQKNVDVAVIEVGMGGRLDATNVICPLVSVITNIGMDHMDHLGGSRREIAREKAGIIKRGVPVVTGEADPDIVALFRRTCAQVGTQLHEAEKECHIEQSEDFRESSRAWHNLEAGGTAGIVAARAEFRRDPALSPPPPSADWRRRMADEGQGRRNLKRRAGKGPAVTGPAPFLNDKHAGRNTSYDASGVYNGSVHIPLLGQHQVQNVKVALTAAHYLVQQGMPLTSGAIRDGIESTQWSGRLEVVCRRPLIIVDGAHNPDGANALAAFLHTIPRRRILIIGCKQGKDIEGIVKPLVPLFERVIVTEGYYCAERASAVARVARTYHSHVYEYPAINIALMKGKRLLEQNSTMVIAGSLYVVGDALAILKSKKSRHAMLQERALTHT